MTISVGKLQLRQIAEFVKLEAAKRRENVAMSGAWGDDGASVLETQVEIFLAGLDGHLPSDPTWVRIAKEMSQKADPDFAEYQRLKAKFE